MSSERNPARVGRFEWQQVPWSATPVMTRGSWGGLPAFGWGWADPRVLATRRQLTERGLRPGGQDPAAVVLFGHTDSHRHWRRADHAYLYQVEKALRKRQASPAQLAALDKALAARRTCTECGDEQDYYLSTLSRQCSPCEDASGFWDRYYEQRFGPDTTAASPARAPGTAGRCAQAVEGARRAVAELRHEPAAIPVPRPAPVSAHPIELTSTDRALTAEEVA